MNIFDDVISVIEGFSKLIMFSVLLITAPIWAIPYVIYKEIKKREVADSE